MPRSPSLLPHVVASVTNVVASAVHVANAVASASDAALVPATIDESPLHDLVVPCSICTPLALHVRKPEEQLTVISKPLSRGLSHFSEQQSEVLLDLLPGSASVPRAGCRQLVWLSWPPLRPQSLPPQRNITGYLVN